jgi:U3 small nucleolar RNA-associated protein 10
MLAGVRTAALKHAEAFIRALLSSQAETISKDLQVVLPFFVGAVYDANQNIRHAAVTCISLIASVRREEGAKAPEVYALKSLPEETSGALIGF